MVLAVKDLEVRVGGKKVLRGVSLEVSQGEVVALMGPNGSGKSSLAYTLAGHPAYRITGGELKLGRVVMNEMTPDERAKKGLFLAFQYPVSLEGVSIRGVILAAVRSKGGKVPALKLRKKMEAEAKQLGINQELLSRDLNQGFSGGEKKKMEILQLRLLQPKFALLDETDSGLDIDALKIVAQGAKAAVKKGAGVLVITHYRRILEYLIPDRVAVMKQGKIVAEGDGKLVERLEKEGYKDL